MKRKIYRAPFLTRAEFSPNFVMHCIPSFFYQNSPPSQPRRLYLYLSFLSTPVVVPPIPPPHNKLVVCSLSLSPLLYVLPPRLSSPASTPSLLPGLQLDPPPLSVSGLQHGGQRRVWVTLPAGVPGSVFAERVSCTVRQYTAAGGCLNKQWREAH